MTLLVQSCPACGTSRCGVCEVYKQMRWQCTSALLPSSFTIVSPPQACSDERLLPHAHLCSYQQTITTPFRFILRGWVQHPSSHFQIHGHQSSTAIFANPSASLTPDSNSPKKHRVPSSKWHFRTLDMHSSSTVLLAGVDIERRFAIAWIEKL